MVDINLPNPGGGRYWEIKDGSSGDLLLLLMESYGAKVCSEYVYGPATATKIEDTAQELLMTAASMDFIGVYKFERES